MIHRNTSYNVKQSDHTRSIPAQCKYTTKLKLINSNKTYFIYNLNDFISSNNAVMDEINELKRAVSIFIKLNLKDTTPSQLIYGIYWLEAFRCSRISIYSQFDTITNFINLLTKFYLQSKWYYRHRYPIYVDHNVYTLYQSIPRGFKYNTLFNINDFHPHHSHDKSWDLISLKHVIWMQNINGTYNDDSIYYGRWNGHPAGFFSKYDSIIENLGDVTDINGILGGGW